MKLFRLAQLGLTIVVAVQSVVKHNEWCIIRLTELINITASRITSSTWCYVIYNYESTKERIIQKLYTIHGVLIKYIYSALYMHDLCAIVVFKCVMLQWL